MVPDFHYFFPYGPSRFDSHSPAGLVVFCLPVGVVAYLLYHLLIAPLAWAVAPAAVRARLDPAAFRGRLPSAGPLAVLVSMGVGILTHVAWDAFTHPGTGTRWLPVLSHTLWSGGGYTARVYSLLQHGSTSIGLGVLLWLWRRRPRRAPVTDTALDAAPSTRVRFAMAALVLVPALVAALHTGLAYAETAPGSLQAVRRFVWHGLGGAVRVGALASIAMGLFWRLRHAGRGG